MKVRLCILISKLVTKICKLFKRQASVYPGFIIYDCLRQRDILEYIKYPKYVIAVTGSSGKGSTTDMIYHILTNKGFDVCYNKNGSNGVLAATTLILNNCNNKGEFLHDVLLLECDERHLKLIFKKNKMTHLVLTNITRDQPARNGDPSLVFNDILEAIGKKTTIILNADDPILNRVKYEFKQDVVTYGVAKTNDSYIKSNIEAVDYAYCPYCHNKLQYTFYHYGHIGNYTCPNCDFERGNVDFEATNVNYKNKCITINKQDIYLNKDVLYAVYYTTAAFATASVLGIKDIEKVLNEQKFENKRGKTLSLDGRNVTMLETKNENNLSYYQSLRYIKSQKGKKTVILGFDNVSRRYNFNDLSWLWDVEFELLESNNIDKIFVIGRFKYDIMVRLSVTSLQKDKIVLVENLDTLIEKVKNDSVGDIYTMVCFDMTGVILNKIKEDENANH